MGKESVIRCDAYLLAKQGERKMEHGLNLLHDMCRSTASQIISDVSDGEGKKEVSMQVSKRELISSISRLEGDELPVNIFLDTLSNSFERAHSDQCSVSVRLGSEDEDLGVSLSIGVGRFGVALGTLYQSSQGVVMKRFMCFSPAKSLGLVGDEVKSQGDQLMLLKLLLGAVNQTSMSVAGEV